MSETTNTPAYHAEPIRSQVELLSEYRLGPLVISHAEFHGMTSGDELRLKQRPITAMVVDKIRVACNALRAEHAKSHGAITGYKVTTPYGELTLPANESTAFTQHRIDPICAPLCPVAALLSGVADALRAAMEQEK